MSRNGRIGSSLGLCLTLCFEDIPVTPPAATIALAHVVVVAAVVVHVVAAVACFLWWCW